MSSWRVNDVVCMDLKVQETIGIDLKVWHIERRNKVKVTKELTMCKIWYASLAKHYNKMFPMFIMWFHWILSNFTRFDWIETMDSLGHWTRISEKSQHLGPYYVQVSFRHFFSFNIKIVQLMCKLCKVSNMSCATTNSCHLNPLRTHKTP